ncbi:MAG: TlpA family protein disulfide reductase [Ignavibacteria bacterium]|nr:TlpA family protein disulfide reductase [Ignavibacteria bacterium]
MNNRFVYIFILNVAISASLFAQSNEPSIEGDKLQFSVTDLYGNTVTSNDTIFVGKVIYITLWGTWCPPCISEIPTLIELQQGYYNDGLVVLAIAFEFSEETDFRKEQLQSFIDEYEINYLVMDGGTPKNFENVFPSIKNVEGLPIEIIINRNGIVEVIRNSYGFSDVWAGRLEQEIKTLLK